MLWRISLVAAVAATLAMPAVAMAGHGGHSGGSGGGGGSHAMMMGGGGHPSPHINSFRTSNMSVRHVDRDFRVHRADRDDFRFRHHHRHFFFAGGLGLYGDSCYRQVWTPWGWQWRSICDYDYYYPYY